MEGLQFQEVNGLTLFLFLYKDPKLNFNVSLPNIFHPDRVLDIRLAVLTLCSSLKRLSLCLIFDPVPFAVLGDLD